MHAVLTFTLIFIPKFYYKYCQARISKQYQVGNTLEIEISMTPRMCYQTELGSPHLTRSKANLLTPGYGERKHNIYCRYQAKRTGSLCSKAHIPQWLSG